MVWHGIRGLIYYWGIYICYGSQAVICLGSLRQRILSRIHFVLNYFNLVKCAWKKYHTSTIGERRRDPTIFVMCFDDGAECFLSAAAGELAGRPRRRARHAALPLHHGRRELHHHRLHCVRRRPAARRQQFHADCTSCFTTNR